jgi:hypothetical protein
MYDVTSGDLEIVEAMRDQAASKARQLSVA